MSEAQAMRRLSRLESIRTTLIADIEATGRETQWSNKELGRLDRSIDELRAKLGR